LGTLLFIVLGVLLNWFGTRSQSSGPPSTTTVTSPAPAPSGGGTTTSPKPSPTWSLLRRTEAASPTRDRPSP